MTHDEVKKVVRELYVKEVSIREIEQIYKYFDYLKEERLNKFRENAVVMELPF